MADPKKEHERIRPVRRDPASIARRGATVAVPLFALLIAVSSVASAASPNTTLKAPYKPGSLVLTNPASMSGCGTSTIVSASAFNKTTGIASFSDAANTSWCSTHTNNSALAEGSVALSFGIHVKTTGAHSVQITWLTIATGGVNLSAGTCKGSATSLYSGCTRSAQTFVYGTAYIQDKTAHKKILLTNHWAGNSTYISNYTSCYPYTTCSSTHTGGATGSLHTGSSYWLWNFTGVTLNATHSYALKMTLFGGVRVTLMASGGATLSAATADAQFNTATLGNEEQLISIVTT